MFSFSEVYNHISTKHFARPKECFKVGTTLLIARSSVTCTRRVSSLPTVFFEIFLKCVLNSAFLCSKNIFSAVCSNELSLIKRGTVLVLLHEHFVYRITL